MQGTDFGMDSHSVQDSVVQRLVNIFKTAFDQLGVQVEMVVLEDLVVLIHKAMSVRARNYHNLDHVFSLVDSEEPIITLAALFHDLVYSQVDMGFLPEIYQIISPFIDERDGAIRIVDGHAVDDRLFNLTLDIFDFKPGQHLETSAGLNEFLSALVMAKKLGPILSEQMLFNILLCIEATIPFRKSGLNGDDYFYLLEERANQIVERTNLNLSRNSIEEGIKLAVILANRDVDSFAETDVASYLETTWKLLPEFNVALREIKVYSIREYRQALQSMEISMSRLNAERVFHQFRGEPSDEIYRSKVNRARKNIATGQEYLRIKLLTQAILEALADETGGDAPLSLFMGDLPDAGSHPRRLEDYLPKIAAPEWLDLTSDLYEMLTHHRISEVSFDLSTAPLSLFVYKSLPPNKVNNLLKLAKELFLGGVSSGGFLSRVDPVVLSPIAFASAEMVYTRREQLMKYV